MTDQLTRGDLAAMTPQQIEAARLAGRLDAVLGTSPELVEARRLARNAEPITRDQLRTLNRARDYALVAKYTAHIHLVTD